MSKVLEHRPIVLLCQDVHPAFDDLNTDSSDACRGTTLIMETPPRELFGFLRSPRPIQDGLQATPPDFRSRATIELSGNTTASSGCLPISHRYLISNDEESNPSTSPENGLAMVQIVSDVFLLRAPVVKHQLRASLNCK